MADAGRVAQVNQLYIAPDLVEDYDNGLEYGTAARVLRMVQRGDEREFLIQCALRRRVNNLPVYLRQQRGDAVCL